MFAATQGLRLIWHEGPPGLWPRFCLGWFSRRGLGNGTWQRRLCSAQSLAQRQLTLEVSAALQAFPCCPALWLPGNPSRTPAAGPRQFRAVPGRPLGARCPRHHAWASQGTAVLEGTESGPQASLMGPQIALPKAGIPYVSWAVLSWEGYVCSQESGTR